VLTVPLKLNITVVYLDKDKNILEINFFNLVKFLSQEERFLRKLVIDILRVLYRVHLACVHRVHQFHPFTLNLRFQGLFLYKTD